MTPYEALTKAAEMLEDRVRKRHGWDKHGDVLAILALRDSLPQSGGKP